MKDRLSLFKLTWNHFGTSFLKRKEAVLADLKDNGNDTDWVNLRQIFAVLVLAFMVFMILSFLTYNPMDIGFYTTSPNDPKLNFCGSMGAYFIFCMVFAFGFSVVIMPFFLASLVVKLIKGCGLTDVLKWFLYFQIGLLSFSVMLSMYFNEMLSLFIQSYQVFSAGGLVGRIFGVEFMAKLIGRAWTFVLFLTLFLISLRGVIPFSFLNVLKKLGALIFTVTLQIRRAFGVGIKASLSFLKSRLEGLSEWRKGMTEEEFLKKRKEKTAPPKDFSEDAFIQKKTPFPEDLREVQEKPLEKKTPYPVNVPPKAEKRNESSGASDISHLRKKTGQWEFPPLSYLIEPAKTSLDLEENVQANAEKLVNTLNEFGVKAEISGIESGPVITRYEIQIASGVKVREVTSLDNDIGLAMRAKSVRIIAPIPGKSAIGIEIPNQIRKMVFFKELLTSEAFKKLKAEIPLILGKDISGRAVIADLASMPHLLIAGATGAGKSVCINTIVMSLLYTLSPSEAKIMMVDPKKVELSAYKSLPHLFVPLITNPNKVAMGLHCLIEEMERRYQIFKEAGVKNLSSYNKKDKSSLRAEFSTKETGVDPLEAFPDKLPFIIAIIDELADLMLVAKAEIESSIVRLAQLARAVGIHLILATQRPSVDVVTGLIKANVPARIAFRVAAKVDSRTVLDMGGAEMLLGRGDMLFLNPGDIDLNRIQGAYLEDNEINAVVEHWTKQGEPEYDALAMNAMNRPESTEEPEDPLFQEAVQAIRNSKQASTSFLQKQFRIGYNRASRLIDELEAKGVIGPATSGGKTREIYLDEENSQEE